MAQQIETIVDRVTSILTAAPFRFSQAPTPDSFDPVPLDAIDQTFRLEIETGHAEGGSAYSEIRVDTLRVTVARRQSGNPLTTYTTLLTDVSSLSAAIIRDGAGAGDYNVRDDGRGFSVDHTPGAAYSTVILTLPIDYEAQL